MSNLTWKDGKFDNQVAYDDAGNAFGMIEWCENRISWNVIAGESGTIEGPAVIEGKAVEKYEAIARAKVEAAAEMD